MFYNYGPSRTDNKGQLLFGSCLGIFPWLSHTHSLIYPISSNALYSAIIMMHKPSVNDRFTRTHNFIKSRDR